MTADKLRKIINKGENAKVDFKREWYKSTTKNELKSEFVKDIFALSNGDIHSIDKTAYLIIGITDNKTPFDFDKSDTPDSLDELKKQLLQILNNYAQPEFLSLELEWVALDEHKILVLSIAPHFRLLSLSKPLQLKNTTDKKGTVYYRIGESIQVASADTVKDFEKAFNRGASKGEVSITVHGDVKGVVNAEAGSVINQTIS